MPYVRLDAQDALRIRGTPVLSVLVGPAGAALSTAAAWSEHCGCLHIALRASDPARLAEEVVRTLLRHPRLTSFAKLEAARTLGGLGGDLDRLFSVGGLEATRALERVAETGPVGRLAASVLSRAECDATKTDPWPYLRAAASLIGEEQLPVLTVARSLESSSSVLPTWCAAAVCICEVVPSLRLILPLSAAQWTVVDGHPETRWKAMLRQGRVDLPPHTPVVDTPVAQFLEKTGASSKTHDAYYEAKEAVAAVEVDDSTDSARSAAEAFLFQVLEECPATCGRFVLNQKWRPPHGGRRLEIDLLALDLQIALEVDGYYHFKSPEQYRRDRRKDLMLQRHGFVVLRFLADDVVADLEEILSAVCDFVAWREGGQWL